MRWSGGLTSFWRASADGEVGDGMERLLVSCDHASRSREMLWLILGERGFKLKKIKYELKDERGREDVGEKKQRNALV